MQSQGSFIESVNVFVLGEERKRPLYTGSYWQSCKHVNILNNRKLLSFLSLLNMKLPCGCSRRLQGSTFLLIFSVNVNDSQFGKKKGKYQHTRGKQSQRSVLKSSREVWRESFIIASQHAALHNSEPFAGIGLYSRTMCFIWEER